MVSNAVGVIAVDGVQFVVQPKIPAAHLVYLLEKSTQLPQLANQQARMQEGESFWNLIARWYLQALAGVLRRDLIRDYRPVEARLQLVRGHVIPLPTTRSVLSGRIEITCRFEEFEIDNPLNRVLLEAARIISGSQILDWPIRQRALRSTHHFENVSRLESSDLAQVLIEHRTSYYADALLLAEQIINGHRRTLHDGEQSARSFLIRTPDLVEEGLRNLLIAELGDTHKIEKRSRRLPPTRLTINPDLVIDDGVAIADVKYKLVDPKWYRPDLYQVVAFATGFGTGHGAIMNFSEPEYESSRTLTVGGVKIDELHWPADENIDPQIAADQFVRVVKQWLQSVSSSAYSPTLTRV